MGWFDNEHDDNTPTGVTGPPQPAAAPRPASKPAPVPSTDSGSTLGREIHIDGTIVCDEDLTILGRVDGTIRAKGTLVIAKEADVRAKIDGQRVVVHGKVNGNVHGAEVVVVGQTGRLNGNIESPMLEIIEGAYFKGSVEMQASAPSKPDAAKAADKPAGAPPTDKQAKQEVATAPGGGAKAGAAAATDGAAKKLAGPGAADEPSGAKKQAAS